MSIPMIIFNVLKLNSLNVRKELQLLAISLYAAVAISSTHGSQPFQPHHLRVSEGFENPIGFYDPSPLFSWQLPLDTGITNQTAYRLVVGTNKDALLDSPDLWDSGKVNTDQSVWVNYQGDSLQSRQKVYWCVKLWDDRGRESDWSNIAQFELGLLVNSAWQASWIKLKDRDSAAKLSSIELVSAVYGNPSDPDQQIDITENIQSVLRKGASVFTLTNNFAGEDPAKDVKKKAFITYRLASELIEVEVEEGSEFDLANPSGEKKEFVPEYLRKDFSLDKPIVSARLYITAKGLFEAHLNGERVGNDFMTPGWTPYTKRIETLTYDVTEQIHSGKNAIGLTLGEGWFAGRLQRKAGVYPELQPAVLAQLEISYEDGQKEIVITDSSWTATNKGPLRFSGIYDGAIYEEAKELSGWSLPSYDDSSWSKVSCEQIDKDLPLVPKRHNPVRITQELETIKISQPQPGVYVFDLGQNMVGKPRLNLPVKAGQTIQVRVAEMLNKDGSLYTANYRKAKSRAIFTAGRDGLINWSPIFTFYGFRYVELTGLPEGIEAKKEWVVGEVLHSDFETAGKFESSHAKLNQLQSNIRWGQRGNYLEVPTDCPQRDERLGWTGDAQVFCPTSIFNYDVHSFWTSWLQSVREDQTPEGLIPHVVPDVMKKAGSPGWADVAVVGPWEVYARTGNKRVLEENYNMMKKWTAVYEVRANDGIVKLKGFGDWLQPYKYQEGARSDTPDELTSTAHFGLCAKLTGKAARVLGKEADAKKYERLHREIRSAFTSEFLDENGKLTIQYETQTGYLFAIAFDLVESELIDKVTKNLFRLVVEEADGHLRTGFLGTPLLAPVLDQKGRVDLAYGVLLKETYPSWFYSINQGATTMWERWNSYSHEDGFGNARMNSFNHYAYGSIGQWMYERIAGLAPDPNQPGYKHFYIQPEPNSALNYAGASHETPYGLAAVRWERSEEGFLVNATVPPNTTATFIVPKGLSEEPKLFVQGEPAGLVNLDGQYSYSLAPGSYQLVIK